MTENNKYGYKVCYVEKGKNKVKVYMATNTYDLALWFVRWYEREPPPKLRNPKWEIQEVKTLKEYEKLWRGCPFKDDLS